MAGFFNKMYYGNPNKPDLKKDDVKGSRIKIFFTVLQVRFWQLIQLNLLWSISWIPTIILIYLRGIIIQETNEPASLLFYVLLTICLMIAGPATAGAIYVIRKWANDEHAWVWVDFKDSLKENWKQGTLMMLIIGIAIMLFNLNIRFYGDLATQEGSFLSSFLYYFMIMIFLLFMMLCMFIFPMIVTYRLKLWQIIKNSFILTMVKLPFAFLIFILSMGITFLTIYYLAGILFFVLGLSFSSLIVCSYASWLFDKYINTNISPENYEAYGEHKSEKEIKEEINNSLEEDSIEETNNVIGEDSIEDIPKSDKDDSEDKDGNE